MKITQSGPGRLCRCAFAAAVFLTGLLAVGQAQDDTRLFVDNVPWIKRDADERRPPIVRGQSPIGYRNYGASVPTDGTSFSTVPSPWISVAQANPTAPAYGSAPPSMMAQAPIGGPVDPFAQPMYGDPSLGGAFTEQPAIWQPYVALQGLFGNKNNMGIGQLMMPLYQDGQSLFFADIRGRFDDQQNSEGNFGLAHRQMVDPTWFYGVNAFYDYRHTTYGNNFNQAGVGIEAMSVYWEAKMNGYVPESGIKMANSLTSTQFLNNAIFVNGGFEKAYYGLDGEVGGLLWEEAAGNIELRGFVGGYYFNTSNKNGINFPSVAGPKGRLEFRLYDCPWFGPESRLTLGVEVQNDNVRDFQVAGLARLEIPLGFFNPTRRLTRLERRMLDRIVRDNDIISVAQQTHELGRDSATGRLLNNVNLIDANTANIPAVVAAANPVNGTIVVDGSAGTIVNSGANGNIVLQSGQVFRGGGFTVIGSTTGATANFGTRPTINTTSLNPAIDGVNVANNTSVIGIDFTGGAGGGVTNSVAGFVPLTGVTIANNTFTGAAQGGVVLGGIDKTSSVTGNTSTGNGFVGGLPVSVANGFSFFGNVAGTVTGNTATGNTNDGFGIYASIGGPVQNGDLTSTGMLSNNTATGNLHNGITIENDVNGAVNFNVASGNGVDGINVGNFPAGVGLSDSVKAGGSVSNNTTNGNLAGSGINIFNNVAGKVDGNTSIGNFIDGITVGNAINIGGGNILAGGSVSTNTTTGNLGGSGINIFGNVAGTAGSTPGGKVDGNTSTGNFIDGITIGNALNPGFGNILAGGSVSTNTANGNLGGSGINIFGDVTGNVNGNTATGNFIDGITVAGPAGVKTGGSISTNTVTGNLGGSGINIFNDVAGTVDGNTATGNANDGITVAGVNGVKVGGSISTNTTSGNLTGLGINIAGDVAGKVNTNTANGNAQAGIGVLGANGVLAGGNVNTNIANGNLANAGIFITSNVAGNVNGNTSSGNFNQGIGIGGNVAAGGSVSNNTTGTSTADPTLLGNGLTTGADGILINGNVAGKVDQNTSSGNGNNGIAVNGALGILNTGSLSNNTTNNNVAGSGISIAGDVAGKVNTNIASGNALFGIFVNGPNGVVAGGSLSSNTTGTSATNTALLGNGLATASDGIFILNNVGGNVNQNVSNGNGGSGINVNGVLAGGSLSNNTTNANVVNGIFTAADVAGTLATNTATGNGVDGFNLFSASGLVNSNTATTNTGNGFHVLNDIAGGMFTKNTATNNTLNGFLFDSTMSGTIGNGAANKNTASGNGLYGFHFTGNVTATGIVDSNQSNNNTAGGYFFANIVNGGKVTNNTATSNGFAVNTTINPLNNSANGFSLNTNFGTFTGNTASKNSNNGFALDDGGSNDLNFTNGATGTFSNNAANNNLDTGFRGTNAGGAGNGNTNSGNGTNTPFLP